MARPLYGLMITRGDAGLFADWCRDQLRLYDAVVCLDGTPDDSIARVARDFGPELIHLRERDFAIPKKTDHGLRRVAHAEIVRRFGVDNRVMCCHSDEFCYHDPRKVADLAEAAGHDIVAWFSPHFYPHPSEAEAWFSGRSASILERSRYYHWSYEGDGYPWAEDRLYRNGPAVAWDEATHGNVRPHGPVRPAPFHPILRHYKVTNADLADFEVKDGSSFYRDRWLDAPNRTGLSFPVRDRSDFFVAEVPKYARCDRFDGTFPHPWNLGDAYRPDGIGVEAGRVGPGEVPPVPPNAEGVNPTMSSSKPEGGPGASPADEKLPRRYRRACRVAARGDLLAARRGFADVAASATEARIKALATSDLATLSALQGDLDAAAAGFRSALEIDPGCRPARLNLDLLHAQAPVADPPAVAVPEAPDRPARSNRVRVAILSFLFNWPSTGGGTVHTYELARFLGDAGYEVRHIYARHEPWGIGRVEGTLPYSAEALDFEGKPWNLASIQEAFRRAVDAFAPDHVIVTDSWNSKPLLAGAVRGYPTILRLQALECLCPLNNVRLLGGEGGGFVQCPKHQLADYDGCAACVRRNGGQSGGLHRAERALVRAGTPEYREVLMRAFREAEAVLVVNPLAGAMIDPYSPNVRVVTAGMDPARFPWPSPEGPDESRTPGVARLIFAGLVDEAMKGFDVLHHACALVWERRQDFELVATAEPIGRVDAFTRFIGWQSQDDLPRQIRAADVLMMPTVAQEALGRTAVEAMACGRPVIASRLGGLPFTVVDGATGLLCEPGDPADLARKIATLLDDPALRERLGRAGRTRFEEHYAWPVIIERHYRPLLGDPVRAAGMVARPNVARVPHRADADTLAASAAAFFGLAATEVARMLDSYRAQHEAGGAGSPGDLGLEGAFLLGLAMSLLRPQTIAAVAARDGDAVRRIPALARWLGLQARVVCLDAESGAHLFASPEVEVVPGDVVGRFRQAVLDDYAADLVLLDGPAPALLREALSDAMAQGRCLLAIRGRWRDVLDELLGVAAPAGPRPDALETPTHRLRVFDTPGELTLIAPRALVPGAPSEFAPVP